MLLQWGKGVRTGYIAGRCTIRCTRRRPDGKVNRDSEEANECYHLQIRWLSLKIQRNNYCEM